MTKLTYVAGVILASRTPPGEMGLLGSSNWVPWISVADAMENRSACLPLKSVPYCADNDTNSLLVLRLIVIIPVAISVTG